MGLNIFNLGVFLCLFLAGLRAGGRAWAQRSRTEARKATLYGVTLCLSAIAFFIVEMVGLAMLVRDGDSVILATGITSPVALLFAGLGSGAVLLVLGMVSRTRGTN